MYFFRNEEPILSCDHGPQHKNMSYILDLIIECLRRPESGILLWAWLVPITTKRHTIRTGSIILPKTGLETRFFWAGFGCLRLRNGNRFSSARSPEVFPGLLATLNGRMRWENITHHTWHGQQAARHRDASGSPLSQAPRAAVTG